MPALPRRLAPDCTSAHSSMSWHGGNFSRRPGGARGPSGATISSQGAQEAGNRFGQVRRRLSARRTHRAPRRVPCRRLRPGSEDEVVVLLQELVLASIAAVRHRVRQVLGAVQFDRDARVGAEQIDLQRPAPSNGIGSASVQPKSPLGLGSVSSRRKRNASVALRARPTPSASAGNVRAACTNRFASGRIHAIADQSADAA